MRRHVTLPQGFFLGAASSAWQTEGWNGKKENQDSYMDLWYKNHKSAWHNSYGPAIADHRKAVNTGSGYTRNRQSARALFACCPCTGCALAV